LFLRILVACEYSGRVREAFRAIGHQAVSCDLEPTDIPGPHHQGCVTDIINDGWDMLIGFPPCTYLCLAGIRWNTGNEWRQAETAKAVNFFLKLWNSGIPRICLENPVGVIPRRTGIKWDQMISPWMFGHPEEKKTCLWLKNLPPLMSTKIMEERESVMWKMSPSADRSKKRSLTYQGIASAMAAQWGQLEPLNQLGMEVG
jgi:hypothetical protein